MFTASPQSIARWSVAFVFLYHGLVPKLLLMHPSEIALISATPTMGLDPRLLVQGAGFAEVALAALLVFQWQSRWPLYVAAVALGVLILMTVVFVPSILVEAFNPLSLTVTTLALVWVALNDPAIAQSE